MPRNYFTEALAAPEDSSSSIVYQKALGLSRNVHIPYIKINFGSIDLTWRGDENRPDYFTSLTHSMVVEKASSMTINITYVPHYREDPSKIEREILKSAGLCVVQYGDLASGVVRPYRCLVNDYSVDVEEGAINYSFSLVSAAVSYNLTAFKAPTEKLLGSESTIENVIEVLKLAAKVVESRYIFEDPSSVLSSAKKFSTFDFGGEEMSPIKFLMNTVSKIPCQDSKCRFALSIDDNVLLGDKGRIKVVKIDTSKVQIAYSFNWGTKDGTVLNWVPNFKGSTWLTESRNQENLKEGKASLVSGVNPRTGEIITAEKSGTGSFDYKSADPVVFVNNLMESMSRFSQRLNYCYSGNLTVLGECRPIQVGETVIQVNPIINGQSHISAGNYIVNGVTDTVDGSQGFVTKYLLMRRGDTSTAGAYSGSNSYKLTDSLWVNGSFVPYDKYSPEG